jgi:hypothetical protein
MSIMRTNTETRDVGLTHLYNLTTKEKRMNSLIQTNWLRGLTSLVAALLLSLTMGVGAVLAQNTIWVDATNGADINPGTSVLPVATINKGLDLLQNNGTLIIRGSVYNGANGAGGNLVINTNSNSANNLANLTVRIAPNGPVMEAELQTATIEVDIAGTLTVESQSGAYLKQNSGTLTLTRGNVNIDASSSWRLANATTTISLVNAAAFTGAAPQKDGANVNLSYTNPGTALTSRTAGPVASYGNYGNGNITVNIATGATISFPSAITTTGDFVKTQGAVNLSGNVTAATFTNTAQNTSISGTLRTTGANTHTAGNVTLGALDIDQNYSVTANNLTVNGNVTLRSSADLINAGTGTVSVTGSVASQGTTTNNRALQNTGTGTFNVTGVYTYTLPNGAGGPDAIGTVINNSNTGTMSVGGFTATTASPSGARTAVFAFSNGSTGSLTVTNVTADNRGTGANIHQYQVDVTNTGTASIGGARYRAIANNGGSMTITSASTLTNDLANTAAASLTINGDVTLLNDSDITNSSSGALTVNGSVSGSHLSRLVKTGNGNFTVSGTFTASALATTASADQTGSPVVSAAGTGTMSVSSVVLNSTPTSAAGAAAATFNHTFSNTGTGTLTVSTVCRQTT